MRTLISTGHLTCQDPEGEGTGGQLSPPHPLPLKDHKAIGFLIRTAPNPMNDHKAIKPKFNVWPSWARLRNAIKMAFHWRADDGQILVVFGSSLRSSTKTFFSAFWHNFLDPRMSYLHKIRHCD